MTNFRTVKNRDELPRRHHATGPTMTLGELQAACMMAPAGILSPGYTDGAGFETSLTVFGMFYTGGSLFISARCDTYMNTVKTIDFKGIPLDNIYSARSAAQVLALDLPAETPVYLAVRNDWRGPGKVYSRRGRHAYGPIVGAGPAVYANGLHDDDPAKTWYVDDDFIDIWCTVPADERMDKHRAISRVPTSAATSVALPAVES